MLVETTDNLVSTLEFSRLVVKALGDKCLTNWVPSHVTSLFSTINQCINQTSKKLSALPEGNARAVVTLPNFGDIVMIRSAGGAELFYFLPCKNLQYTS